MVVSRATSGFFVFGVLASLVAGLDRNPNYADEASEIKNMMESVRVQTEGGATKKHAVVQQVASVPPEQQHELFPGLEQELMNKADYVEKDMQQFSQKADSSETKRAVLTSKHQESAHDRAARFFATHGMMDVGHMLGDELSQSEAKVAVKEAAVEQQKLAAVSADVAVSMPRLRKISSTESSAPLEEEDSSIELTAEEEKEELANKQRWKAVDALRHRAPPV